MKFRRAKVAPERSVKGQGLSASVSSKQVLGNLEWVGNPLFLPPLLFTTNKKRG